MKKITVELENPYSVFIGNNIFSELLLRIEKQNLNKNIFLITDNKILKIYRNEIASVLIKHKNKSEIFSIKPGEESKSYQTVNKIYSRLLRSNFGRDTLIISFGGGVVGDISGFVASTFMRGVQYVQIPTTLLASIDSSVGGKTGINFENYKNVIGTFYQPKMVLIDTKFLKTLQKEEIICGVGELMKYAFLSDENFFKFVNKNLDEIFKLNETILEKVIYESIKIKSSIVSKDEKEIGLRKILNLGHTFAHAYETVLDYKIKHGEAVIAGLINAIVLSGKLNLMDNELLKKYLSFLAKVKVSKRILHLNKTELYDVMLKDKKNRNGKIKFVVPFEIGKIGIDVEAEKEIVYETLLETERILEN